MSAASDPRWHVVCSCLATDPQSEDRIWTLSLSPAETGWNTDCGTEGYGLTQAEAFELADAANHLWRLRQEAQIK